MKTLLLVILLSFIVACGKEQPLKRKGEVNITFKFPAALRKGTPGFERFLSTVDSMKITVKVGGREQLFVFPPSQWEKIFLSEIALPEESKGRVEISVEVWDHLPDGYSRTLPILVGHKVISKSELEGNDTASCHIVLHAQESL